MNKYVDMHCHSLFSDGLHDVPELIRMAKSNDVGFFSITDHDNIESTSMIKSDEAIVMVPGIELSTVYNFRGEEKYIHLLGYDYNPTDKKLLEELKRMRQLLTYENIRFLDTLINSKIYLPVEVILDVKLSNYRWIHKQIETSLRKHNYSEEYIEEMLERMGEIIPEYAGYEIPTYKAIEILRLSGGIPVLAHPCELKLDDSEKEEVIEDLFDKGLMGMETSYSYFKPSEFVKYRDIARKYGLLESVGSDFHFKTDENNVIIGHGINDNLLKEDCSLKEYILERKR